MAILQRYVMNVRAVYSLNKTKANPGVVTCLNDEKHGFETDDVVTFREVRGMTELNGTKHKITGTSELCTSLTYSVLTPSSFSIGDTSSFAEYEREGVVQQVKVPVTMSFVRPRCIPFDLIIFRNP